MPKLKIAQELLDIIYPVGSIYLTINNINPQTLFGGTWENMSGGYLYGARNSIGQTSLNGWGTQSTALTVSQIPKHGHWILALNKNPDGYNYDYEMDYDSPGVKCVVNFGTTYDVDEHGWGNSVGMQMTGGNQGHTHDIATIDVFMWKRTA